MLRYKVSCEKSNLIVIIFSRDAIYRVFLFIQNEPEIFYW